MTTDQGPAKLARRNLLEVFGERDPQARATVIDEIFAADVTFADPDGTVTGRDALRQKAQDLLDKAPAEFVFRAAGPVQVAQNLALIAWQFGPAGSAPVVTGKDILIVEDGRIARLYTLLDAPA